MDVGVEFLMPYIIHLVVLYVSVYVIYLIYKQYYHYYFTSNNLPPGKKGLPFIGETLDYMLALRRGIPEKFVADRITKHSPHVFRTSLLGDNVAVFCGPAGNKFIFTGQDKYVTKWWPRSLQKVMIDPFASFLSNEKPTTLRQYVSSLLKPEYLKDCIPVMDMVTKQHLHEHWSPYNRVKVFPLSKKYTLAAALRIFIGIQEPDMVEKLAKPFARITAGLISLPINLPGTPLNRAVKASELIRQELWAIIMTKKNEILEKGKTVVASDMVDNMLMDGFTEMEICMKIFGLVFASHDTTSTAITFTISYLTDFPDVYNKVLEEQMEVSRSKGHSGKPLKWEDIQKMKYSWCVVSEAMRLTSPTNGAFSVAITDFTYAGYTIPKGWKTFSDVHSTNKNPEYFPNPEKFDPSRFEGNGPPPYTFVPFGGGSRICPGREFARLVILTFIHNLVTKFKWQKLNPNEKISYNPFPIPEEGLPINLQVV